MSPRRTAQGLDINRMALVLTVLEKHCGHRFSRSDVFASVVGGVRVIEPAADLGLALALASAHSGVPLPPDIVACGEVGLAGEVRQVPQLGRRLGEAARLGFRYALVPASCREAPKGMELVRVATLKEAMVADLGGAAGPARPSPPAPRASDEPSARPRSRPRPGSHQDHRPRSRANLTVVKAPT
jgi:DNA repair protein RadA/Sms